jgi:hypothetical protein
VHPFFLCSFGGRNASVRVANVFGGESFVLEDLVVLERVERSTVSVVRRTVGLLEASVGVGGLNTAAHHSAEVDVGEDTIVGHGVVHGVRLIVVQVLEAGGVVLTQDQRHEGVSVVDSVGVLTIHKLEKVVLDNGVLGHSGILSRGSTSSGAVTEGEHVLEGLVLESVLVDIDETLFVKEASALELLLRIARRVNASGEEVLLDGLTAINVLEYGDLLVILVLVDLDHFPTEHNINASLVALVKGNLVGVGESEDLLVRGPELDLCVLSSSTNHFVLSHEVLIVESIEVATFTLVWELRGIADHVTVGVVPSVVVVRVSNSLLVVESMKENSVLEWVLRKLSKSLDLINVLIETGTENESFVVVFLTVLKLKLVVLGVKLGDLVESINLGPTFDLSRHGGSFQVKISHVTMGHSEVSMGLDEARGRSDNSHLVVTLLLLDKLEKGGSVDSTDEDNIEVSAVGVNVSLLGTTTSEATGADLNHSAIFHLALNGSLKETG